MKPLDKQIVDIVDKGLEGNGLDENEVLALYRVDPTSREASTIRWAGMQLSQKAANGKAEVHAQIGLNAAPCGNNCKFCSFAVSNGVRTGCYELPKKDVLEYAKIYEDQGANLILMLTTAGYKFQKLIEMVESVREVISPEMPLLVNTADMTLEQTLAVRRAGANGAYHAVRMREGVDTKLPVERRLATIDNIHKAGLHLSTCVEPVGPENTPEELTEATMRCIATDPLTAGVGKRINVPGTEVFDRGMISDVTNALYVAVYRLACGDKMALNCSANSPAIAMSGANLAWAEVGTNPRDTVERTEKGGRGSDIEHCRTVLVNGGWELLDGPSQGWEVEDLSPDVTALAM
ncbi:MAG: radical SAM protein [Eggerthellaceae bacterium]|jgi:biotin synthase